MLTLKTVILGYGKLRSKVRSVKSFALKKVVPVPFANVCSFQCDFDPLTDPQAKIYNTVIVFHGLTFALKKDQDHPKGIEIFPGQVVWMEQPSFSNTPVGVSCTCKDYFFTFWYWNMRNATHAGKNLPPYVRKTPPPPVGYPYRNPNHVPAGCKHILRMARYLSERGLIKP